MWVSGFGRAGVNGVINDVTTNGNDVYVVGDFTHAGNTAARRIAKWDGSKWTSPGGGLPLGFGEVEAVAVIGSNIYVAGEVSSFDPAQRSGIMKWDGANWSFLPASATNGLANRVRALAVSGNDLYVAGELYIGEGMNAVSQPLLKWDGGSWSRIGNNLEGSGEAVAISGSNIYLGGLVIVGESNANGIAKWDGVSWLALGSGVSTDGTPGGVRAIAVSGTDVYVGGGFTSAGGLSANYVAKWNGSNWSALGMGESNGVNFRNVYALAVSGTDVYVGGSFSVAGGLSIGSGGVSAFNVAKWNGSNWSALGTAESNGVSTGQFTAVHAIATSGTGVFIAGDFTKAAGASVNYVAKWSNGFSELGGEILNGLNGVVYAMAVIGNDVYVGGTFTTAGGLTVNHVARWDGAGWNALGSGAIKGVNGDVYAMAASGSDLYVGGVFNQAGGALAIGVAKWDGANWSSLSNGMANGVNGLVESMAASGSDVYVGGHFTSAGGVAVNNIAKWNGANWSALGSGLTTTFGQAVVYDIKTKGSDVYAGGNFDRSGGNTINAIARWDGANWHALGGGVTISGLSGTVYAMDFSGPDLYAGGSFSFAGGVEANNIAVWDGANWSALNSGGISGVSDVVFAVKGDDKGVYVGGYVPFAGALNVKGIARWDGSQWTAFGSGTGGGFGGDVRAIGLNGTRLYAGGTFTTAGSKPSHNFGIWDGSALLSATSQSFTVSGGTGRVSVNMPGGCNWDAKSNDTWIVLTSAPSNIGPDTVTFEVRENFSALPRTGTMTIAGQTFTIRQAGLAIQVCLITISPLFNSFTQAGGSGTISVATSEGCLWTATSKASWITITSERSGLGSGSLSYRVAANTTGNPRAGKITINGQSFSVKQQ